MMIVFYRACHKRDDYYEFVFFYKLQNNKHIVCTDLDKDKP